MRPIAMQLKTRKTAVRNCRVRRSLRFRCGSLSIDARCASNPRRTLRKVSTRICDRAPLRLSLDTMQVFHNQSTPVSDVAACNLKVRVCFMPDAA